MHRLPFPAFLAVAVALSLAGCQLPTGGNNPARAAAEAKFFAIPGSASKKSSIGQLRYVTPARAVIGDTVVNRTTDGSHFQTDFTAGPGVPLMRLQIAGNEAVAEGLFAWGHWRGKTTRPGRLAQWVALRDVFQQADHPAAKKTRLQKARSTSTPPAKLPWEATIERHRNGSLHRVSVEFPTKKERFTFVFAQ